MDGWWKDVGDDDDDEDLLQIPVPVECQNGVSGYESRFLMVVVQRNSIWVKRRTPDVFRSEGICRRKEGSRRWPRRPHHPLARPGLGRATRWCGALLAPLRLVFWLCGSSGKIGFFCSIFRDFSCKLDFCTKTRHQGNSAKNSVSPC
jgi:hypothetical protein